MNKAFFIMLFFAIVAFGQQQERIAIINIVDDKDSIGISDLNYLKIRLRNIAGEVLPRNIFFSSLEVKTCKEASCLVYLGRKLGADYVAHGRIGRFDGTLTLNVEIYESKYGNLLASLDGNSQNLSGLLSILDAKAPDMLNKMLPANAKPKSKPNRPLSLCLRVGVNSSNVDETYVNWRTDIGRKINTGSHFGYQAIAMLDKPLSRVFHIQPGIRLIQRGATYRDDENDENYEISLLYFGAFFQPTIKLSLNENVAFKIYNGPYFDFRLVEKSGVPENLFIPMDIGLTTGFGIAFGKFYIGIFYDYGLIEVSQMYDYDTFNRTFGINLGYKR
jgi:hypothetical protein